MGHRGVLGRANQGGSARRTSPLTPRGEQKRLPAPGSVPALSAFISKNLEFTRPPGRAVVGQHRPHVGREGKLSDIGSANPSKNAHRPGNPQVFGFTSVIATRAACWAGGEVVEYWSTNASETRNRPETR